jgi:hypothetical protein
MSEFVGARKTADHVCRTVRALLPKWETWFPNEKAEVEIPRCDLLLLVEAAEAGEKSEKRLEECYELLKRVRQFIENGTTFGYIDPLKPGTPEHKTAADVGWVVCQLQQDRMHGERPRSEGGGG